MSFIIKRITKGKNKGHIFWAWSLTGDPYLDPSGVTVDKESIIQELDIYIHELKDAIHTVENFDG